MFDCGKNELLSEQGRCECMYGELPNGDCTLCKDPCGAFSECDESSNADLKNLKQLYIYFSILIFI